MGREQIHEAAEIAMRAECMICSRAMGVTQQKSGVANVQTIANFALLRAQIGRKGAGLCPHTAEALAQCSLTVHVSTKLKRAHLVTGTRALSLPCLGRTEIDMKMTGIAELPAGGALSC
jgi:anaerobic selenocysteine-containing dehydrogenase